MQHLTSIRHNKKDLKKISRVKETPTFHIISHSQSSTNSRHKKEHPEHNVAPLRPKKGFIWNF